MTSLPLVLAEELDADWSKVRIVPAPVIDQIYGNPAYFHMIYTAGSNAVRVYFTPLRMFGAQVRRVLIDNAAAEVGCARRRIDDRAERHRAREVRTALVLRRDRRLRRGPRQGAGDQKGEI